MVHAKDEYYDSIITGTFPDLLLSKRYHDVVFICKDNHEVQGHRLLLASVSPFLHNLFTEQAREDTVVLIVPDYKADDVLNVLRFAYEGVVRLDQGEMEQFNSISEWLGIHIPKDIINSETGDIYEDKKDIVTEDVPRPAKSKREVEDDHQHRAKRARADNAVINNINEIVSNLSIPPDEVENRNSNNEEETSPLSVPIEDLITCPHCDVLKPREGKAISRNGLALFPFCKSLACRKKL